MHSENAIEVRDVTKKFKVYLDKGSQLKERLLFRSRNRYEERSVLNGISFDVKKGEAIGLIGHNGCGKSTTLKLLTRIMYPDSGSIEMGGRVSSLIELGAGFHPDMSGRENIYTNAAIFGLTKKEIDARMDDIVKFSELEEFLDNPVRTYSSGMYMRLAFSVAINVDADILLIDEILAVGDVNFQTKCFNRLKEIKEQGTTIVIVSHSMDQIEKICDRSIWIHEGKIRAEGTTFAVHTKYLKYMEQKRLETDPKASGRWGNGKAHITNVALYNEKGENTDVFSTEGAMTIEFSYEVKEKVENAVFGIGIFRADGAHCYGTNTRLEKYEKFDLEEDGVVRVHIPRVALLASTYILGVTIESEEIPIDYHRDACKFEVVSDYPDVGVTRLAHTWEWTTNAKEQE